MTVYDLGRISPTFLLQLLREEVFDMATEKTFKELSQSELEKTVGGNTKDFLIAGAFDWFKNFNNKPKKQT